MHFRGNFALRQYSILLILYYNKLPIAIKYVQTNQMSAFQYCSQTPSHASDGSLAFHSAARNCKIVRIDFGTRLTT